jgi:hypothetical protein
MAPKASSAPSRGSTRRSAGRGDGNGRLAGRLEPAPQDPGDVSLCAPSSLAMARWLMPSPASSRTCRRRIDYQRGLTRQFPIPAQRVVYTKTGTNLAAARVEGADAVIDHKLYWAPVRGQAEARYLVAILNSGGMKERVNLSSHAASGGSETLTSTSFTSHFLSTTPAIPSIRLLRL